MDLKRKEAEILDGLMDFQRATVERVFDLFKSDYSRVLVAEK
ncbi:hypothetical protein [Piscibacillus salipiscarius]|nr:hypothetical protein [Piscibacillus salipiscarius]